MRKQPQVTAQTRSNLRQAFWDLYAERPLEKISVREITDRAGYNRATFYLYYHDVYELLGEIEDQLLDVIERLVNERLMRGEKLDFSQHMSLILRLADRSREYTRVLLGERGDPAFAQRLKKILSPLVDRFFLPEEPLGEQAEGIVREFYLSGIVATIRAWTSERDPMPIQQLIDIISRVVLRTEDWGTPPRGAAPAPRRDGDRP